MDRINSLIANKVDLYGCDYYAAIIGENPSKGARSPLLWNAAFDTFGIRAKMLPLDIADPKLVDLINELEKDQRFIGGAVAFPFKSLIAEVLRPRLSSAANAIGAINCIYRDELGFLAGTNTDGEASIQSLKKNLPSLDGLSALVLGTGGASKAVCAYLAPELGSSGRLSVAYRNNPFPSSYLESVQVYKQMSLDELPALSQSFDLIINCTLLGGQKYPDASPLESYLQDITNSSSFIYDINYDPLKSPLLQQATRLGLRCLNGIEMNLLQAIIAFQYACNTKFGNQNHNDLYKAMTTTSTTH